MYQAYWGLGQSPFAGQLDPRYFYLGPPQEEALARLHFLVEQQRALAYLLGEPGSGKSQLLHVFAGEVGRVTRQIAQVSLGGIDPHEFFWLLGSPLGIEARSTFSTFALWRALIDHLAANRYQQVSTVLLLDDADLATPAVIDQVLRLLELDTARQLRLSVVLAANRRRCRTLGERLWELADMRIELEPWEPDDTAAFLKKSLAVAGRTAPVFSESALVRIHELAEGRPRRAKQLADLALVAGAGGGLIHIDGETIDAVAGELAAGDGNLPVSEPARH